MARLNILRKYENISIIINNGISANGHCGTNNLKKVNLCSKIPIRNRAEHILMEKKIIIIK
jgi:hypothetical protein